MFLFLSVNKVVGELDILRLFLFLFFFSFSKKELIKLVEMWKTNIKKQKQFYFNPIEWKFGVELPWGLAHRVDELKTCVLQFLFSCHISSWWLRVKNDVLIAVFNLPLWWDSVGISMKSFLRMLHPSFIQTEIETVWARSLITVALLQHLVHFLFLEVPFQPPLVLRGDRRKRNPV